MAKITIPLKNPTFGIPGVKKDGGNSVIFKDRNAACKWFALVEAEKARQKWKAKRQSHLDLAARHEDNAKKQSKNSHVLNNIAKKNRDIAADIQKKLDKAAEIIKKAIGAAKECSGPKTKEYAQLAKEYLWAGVDTSGPRLGLPKPDKSSAGVPGIDGKTVNVRLVDKEKLPALVKLLKRMRAAEEALNNLQVENEFADKEIKAAEDILKKLKEQLRKAKANLKNLQRLDPYSLEGTVQLEAAQEAVKALEEAIKKLQEALAAVKGAIKEKKKGITGLIKQLKEALAYKRLKRVYESALKCDTERTKSTSKKIIDRIGKLPEQAGKLLQQKAPGPQKKKKSLGDLVDDAEKKAKEAAKATDPKNAKKIEKADKNYFDGLYKALHANFLKRKSKAPIKVDDFLKFMGGAYKLLLEFKCKMTVNGKEQEITIKVKHRWKFGPTPKPAKDEPKDKKGDGMYKPGSMPYSLRKGVIVFSVESIIALFWVGKFNQTASNKGLLYHEYLHGQLWLEYIKSEEGKKALCKYLENGFKKGAARKNVAFPQPDSDIEHKRINPAQKKFQEAIEKAERKATEKAKREAKK
ncbi:MAG: hypothetical protein AAF065_05495 [Verrucomicrobiota bacterium]